MLTILIGATLSLAAASLSALTIVPTLRDADRPAPAGDEDPAAYLADLRTAPTAVLPVVDPVPGVPLAAGYEGQHRPDTVRPVGDGHMPLYSPAFAAALGYRRAGGIR